MAAETEKQGTGGVRRPGARIEGGLDAIVVGATFDGLAAAALLAKAGLKTVLLAGHDASSEAGPREFAPGHFCADGEHLIDALDPDLIAGLDLYRHGLAYAARRLDTVYVFDDGGALTMDGDLYRAREAVAAMAEADAPGFAAFQEAAFDAARALRPMFEGASPEANAVSPPVEPFLYSAVEEALDALFTDEKLKALLAAEALARSAARPDEPFGFLNLVRRWSGEAAGLQGALAYPAGGAAGVNRAMRRAAQAARVDFRLAVAARRVLVEWDAAAGVETEDGGQIRAPVIVNALPAGRAFGEMIGPALLDIEFQAHLAAPAAPVSWARACLALEAKEGGDPPTERLSRRAVFVPSRLDLRRAYRAARMGWPAGEPVPPLIAEAVFPSAFESELAPEGAHVCSMILHPAPSGPGFEEQTAEAARAALSRLLPGFEASAVDVTPPQPAAPVVMSAWARARALSGGGGVHGYFFCGPEAQIGPGLSGAAGRRAAEAALRYFKSKAAAA